MNDPSYSNSIVAGGSQTIIAVDLFAQFDRLEYDLGAVTATFNAYYNAQA